MVAKDPVAFFPLNHKVFCNLLHALGQRPISYPFRDKRRFQSNIAKFSHPVYFASPLTGFPLELGTGAWSQKHLE